MTRVNIIIATAISALTITALAYINRPEVEPNWPTRIHGFSFSPLRPGNDPAEHLYPTVKEIDADLALLQGKAKAVRTYSTEGTLGEIAPLAKKHGMTVTLGAWISSDLDQNEREVSRVIELANANRNVEQVIVGNEVLYRKELTQDQLVSYIERVRKAVRVPVSTAEQWDTWLMNQDLATHVDFIAAHILPYWQRFPVEQAVGEVQRDLQALKTVFPRKRIVIAEVGWPSRGRTHGAAAASAANEATFLRRFLSQAEEQKYEYFVMEAFDQPWKQSTEGAVGAYWGVWNAERKPKFSFHAPIVPHPEWKLVGGFSILIALITFTLMVVPSRTLRRRGRSFLAVIAYVSATTSVWIVYDYVNQYLTLTSILIGILLLIGLIGVVMVVLTEAHEWAEVLWFTERRRALKIAHLPDNELPMVSVHVPAYNEPAEMVKETLDALSRLEYPCFEVIVVDNNTRDPAVWKPVQAHCEKLGKRFRFFHVEPLAGFKAGALNFALRHTAPEAEIIAVIDSDYVVTSRWLRDLTPEFKQPNIAIVQAPQDYRDGTESAFKAMCYSEYAGFFYTGMITRNERNAIIQHGTMTLVRRTVLEKVGGWAEWCITEDAELGLRIFTAGYEAKYIPHSYGRGLMPDTFNDYKKQRFRWAYGAIQIMRHHFGALIGTQNSGLAPGQRYHFLAGWLPWIADGFNLIFTIVALFWSLAMVIAPKVFEPPLTVFSALPIALFVFKLAKLAYIYKGRIGASTAQTFAGAMAGLALAHTIARAVLAGFVTRGMPFIRTPKRVPRQAWRQALLVVREEASVLAALVTSAIALMVRADTGNRDTLLWIIVLLVQALPYLMAVAASFISSFPRLSANRIGVRWIDSGESSPKEVSEPLPVTSQSP